MKACRPRVIQSLFAGIKSFSPQNIQKMKQFCGNYAGNVKLSPLVREIKRNIVDKYMT
jgi:hypothetical protein